MKTTKENATVQEIEVQQIATETASQVALQNSSGAQKSNEVNAGLSLFSTSKDVLSKDDLQAIADSGLLEEEGTSIIAKVAGSDWWKERIGEVVTAMFTGTTSFESDFGQDDLNAANLTILSKDSKGMLIEERIICPNKMISSELPKHGKGLYKITYLGKKKGGNFAYDNFEIKLIRLLS